MRLLNTSIKINNMELKNRLVMPPMAISKADENGKATSETFNYYDEKSAGGYIGLIIAEHSYVSPEGKAGKGQLSISDDSDIQGLQEIVSIVHKNGTKIMAQINHAGAAAKPDVSGLKQLSASAVRMPNGSLTAQKQSPTIPLPKEMSVADIQKAVADFTSAALRAKTAGFDGVEIHSAHGYLLNQFYSPLTNKRIDEYTGNTIQGRIKLHLEIIRSIREAVGNDYPLALRLGACDYIEGGSTIADSILAVKEFQKAGIDFIDISGGFCGYMNPFSQKPGYFDELSKAIKDSVSIPVVLTGGIADAQAAEMLLKQEKADLIGVGRAILKDSAWARKAMRFSC
ncbi:MAG: NADH:flavin oxidoreductase [Clostridiales bacterium]|nr:NADH:flavin oxidoreductase [Clostridiales bacterium]